MGTNGTNTITALKTATGVADNRLSAHHPNGAGNATSFGDFHFAGYQDDAGGGWDEDDVPSTIYPDDQFSLYLRPSVGNTTLIGNERGSDSFIEMILETAGNFTLSNNLQLVSVTYPVTTPDGTATAAEFIFEATAVGNAQIIYSYGSDGGLNSDITNYNSDVTWSGTIDTPPVTITTFTATATSSSTADITYEFEDGLSNWDIVVTREDRDAGTTNAWANNTTVHTATQTADSTQYSFSESSLDNTKEYRYTLDVTADSGAGSSDTDTTILTLPA